MTAHRVCLAMVVTALLGFSSGSWALTIPNPDPTIFDPDIDGNGLFVPGPAEDVPAGVAFSVEIVDIPDLFAIIGRDFVGSEFGFFFASDPDERYTLFGIDDSTFLGGTQSTLIDFIGGTITDFDSGGVVNFDPTIPSTLGFYLILNDPDYQAAFGTSPFFTVALMNGGEDHAAEFPITGGPGSFLISFGVEDALGDPTVLGSYLISGISSVPVPAAVWLFGTALIGLLGMRRKPSPGLGTA